MTLSESVSFLADLRQWGPQPAQYSKLQQAFKKLAKSEIPDHAVYAHLVETSYHPWAYNLIDKIFKQPYGYAGDFDLMNTFYEAYDKYDTAWAKEQKMQETGRTASLWDHFILSLKCSTSVYNREAYLMKEISELIWTGKVTKVLDIACGNGRLIKKLAVRHPHTIFHGIDNEPQAIRAAMRDRPANCAFGQMNALRKLPIGQHDLVVSAGLCDYLTDRHVQRLIRRIEKTVNPKYVILGNLKDHEDAPLMELLKWKLIYRDTIDLVSLAIGSFKGSKFRVGREELGVNLFLHIEPKE